MQVLIFHLGADRFALPTQQVVQVLPLLATTAIPGAPAFIAGLINYHGQAVPLVDLRALNGGQASRERLDTRIVLVDYPGSEGAAHLLGLIAEGVTGTARIDARHVRPSGVDLPQVPHLGQVVSSGEGILQLVEVAQLLPAAVCDLLFQRQAVP
ncbi:MAG: chemotaxis protein CheW [Pseudomonas sp.]|uniref:chemotaxis protein CheW n=1 Tax=Pseudomonas sp. TaxID=306 RepID=UPI0033920F1F